MSSQKVYCVVLGAGGHARVVLEALSASGRTPRLVFVDADPSLWGKEYLGIPVAGGDDRISHLVRAGVDCFIVGVGGTSDTRLRRDLFLLGLEYGLAPETAVHPSAVVSPSSHIGEGCQILAGAVVNAGAVLGVNVIVNTGAIVEHDCIIEDHAHLATGSRLAGGVRVAEGAHIGLAACVREGRTVGRQAILGAGAVAVRDVPDGVVVCGVPARVLREVSR